MYVAMMTNSQMDAMCVWMQNYCNLKMTSVILCVDSIGVALHEFIMPV